MAMWRRRAAVHGSADPEWQDRCFIGLVLRVVGVASVDLPDYSAVDRVAQLVRAAEPVHPMFSVVNNQFLN